MAYQLRIERLGYENGDSWGFQKFKVDATQEKIQVGFLGAVNTAGDLVPADAATGKKAVTIIYTATPLDAFGAYVTDPTSQIAYYYTIGGREARKIAEQTRAAITMATTDGQLRKFFRMKNENLTGTFATTNTSKDIVGTGSKALTELKLGEKITINGTAYVVETITDDTHFSVTAAATATASGKAGVGLGMYGEPLWLATTGGDLPFTMLKPASNAQYVGKITGTINFMYDLSPIIV